MGLPHKPRKPKKPGWLERLKNWRNGKNRKKVVLASEIKTAEKKEVDPAEQIAKQKREREIATIASNAGIMKKKALKYPGFVKACTERGLDPGTTFTHFCEMALQDKNAISLAREARAIAVEKKAHFSPTRFFTKYIMAHYLGDIPLKETGGQRKG
jgi:hypothetical protein